MSQLHRTGSFAVSLVVRGPSDPTLASTAAAAAGVAPPSSAEAYSDSCMVLACPVLQMQCTLRVHLPLSAPRARSHAGAALAPALPAVDRAARSRMVVSLRCHSNLVSACKVPDFRITGRAQFLIGTVPGYMNMKFSYTEFQYR
jgi:hypothetical protein